MRPPLRQPSWIDVTLQPQRGLYTFAMLCICKKIYNTYGLSRDITYVGLSTTKIGGRIEVVEMLGK